MLYLPQPLHNPLQGKLRSWMEDQCLMWFSSAIGVLSTPLSSIWWKVHNRLLRPTPSHSKSGQVDLVWLASRMESRLWLDSTRLKSTCRVDLKPRSRELRQHYCIGPHSGLNFKVTLADPTISHHVSFSKTKDLQRHAAWVKFLQILMPPVSEISTERQQSILCFGLYSIHSSYMVSPG